MVRCMELSAMTVHNMRPRDRLWNMMMKQNIYCIYHLEREEEKMWTFLGNSISYDFVCSIAINEDEDEYEEKSNLLSVESLIRRGSSNRCSEWNTPFNSDSDSSFFLDCWNAIYFVKCTNAKSEFKKKQIRRLNQRNEFFAHKSSNIAYNCAFTVK